jgi:hypothetical protein
MATEAQLRANRENAKKSTGPRTEEGKAKARFNARRHGLTGVIFALAEDDAAAYDEMEQGFVERLQPEGPIEKYLVGLIARGYWRIAAAAADETNQLSLRHEDFADQIEADSAEFHAASIRARIARLDKVSNFPIYESRICRAIRGHERRLADLQADRKAAEARRLEEAELLLKLAHMEKTALDVQALEPEIGFVFTDARLSAELRHKLTLEQAEYYRRHNWDATKTWKWAGLKMPVPVQPLENR